MNSGCFVSKPQFQAVVDHFVQVVKNAEAEGNVLHREFNLLLEYFKSVFSDSERKSSKIRQLSTKVSRMESELRDLNKARATETEDMSLQLFETKCKIDELVRKEHALLSQMDDMQDVINRLKRLYEDDSKEGSKSKEDGQERTFRDFGIITDAIEEELQFGWQSCEICSKKSSEAVNLMLQEMDFHDRYEAVVAEKTTEVNALVTELELVVKERDELTEATGSYAQLLIDLEHRLQQGERHREGLEAHISIKESLQKSIEKLVKDLQAKKAEIQNLQDALEREVAQRRGCVLESRAKDTDLENMKQMLQAEQESKAVAMRKASIFEEHLATDRERREALQADLGALRAEADALKRELKNSEMHQRTLLAQMKTTDLLHKNDLVEHSRVLENYKGQVTVKDKKIQSLINKLEETEQQAGQLKKQMKEKTKTFSAMAIELNKLKSEFRCVSSDYQTTTCRLQALKAAFEEQRAKLERLKNTNDLLLKEKNKFFCRYRELDAKLESQKFNTQLLYRERDYHRKVLKAIDNEVGKFPKKEKMRPTFRY